MAGLGADEALVDRERATAALRRHSREMLVLIDEDGVATEAMRSGPPLLGYEPGEQEGRHVGQYVHPDDLAKVLDVLERGRCTPGLHPTVMVRARHRAGHWVALEVEATDARADPDLAGFVLRITELKTVSAGQTAEQTDQFESLAEIVPFGILSADQRGWVVFANEAATDLFERSVDELLGSGWLEAVQPEDRGILLAAATNAMRSSDRPAITFRIPAAGGVRWAVGRFTLLRTAAGNAGWVATFHDVTEERMLEAELSHLATHDPLTGLPNRVLLGDRLDQALARLSRVPGSVSVLFIDLNGFKAINDRLGHAAGDGMLTAVADRILAITRPADTAARLGGDEFVIVCERLSPDDTEAMARRVIAAVGAPVVVGDEEVTTTACVGVSYTEDADESATDLLARADGAMYRAKRDHTHLEVADGPGDD